MSKITDVSHNKNKRSDSMIYDDAGRTDCCVDGSKKQNTTNILKNKSEIPPINDIPSSEVQSILSICGDPPRSKKRKLSSFDELIKNLDYGELYMNLTKLLFFLESDNNNCFFFLIHDYEVFFEMLVKDINILKSKSLDDDYRHISDKLIKAAAGKRLFYVFEDRPEFPKKVMVIKKEPIMDQSGNCTASSSCGSSMLPSQTSTKVDTKDRSRSLFPPAISSGFKIHCLRTLLVFIKNDAIKTKEFPELSTDQAKFMQLLLGKVNKDNFDRNKDVTDLYRELVHAVKMNELNYEFRIKCNESSGGKKSVVFEKVPVLKPSETAVNSDQTADKSKQNPKTNVQITEDPNTGAPKPDAPNPEFLEPDTPKSHGPKKAVLKPNTTKSNGAKIDVPKPDTTKSNGPEIDVLKPDTTTSNGTKIDVLKPGTTKSNGPEIDVLKPDTTTSNGTKIDVLKPDTTKSNGPEIDVLKPDTSTSNGTKIDVLKPDTTKSNGPEIDVLKPDTTTSNGTKIDVLKPNAPNSNDPKIDVLKPDTTKLNDPKIDVLKPDTTKSINDPKTDVLKPDTIKSNGPKIDVPKAGGPESHGPKIDVPKAGAPESHGPKIDVLKPDTTKSNGRNMDFLKPDIPKSYGPKIDVPNASKSQEPKMDVPQTDAPESHGPKTSDSGAAKTSDSGTPTTEPPQPDVAEPWFKTPKPLGRTKKMTNCKKKKIIENTPKDFIEDTLNKILDFLLNDDMEKMVLVPKTESELIFYRLCIIWCSSGEDLSQFGEEFREIHCRISHLLCQLKFQVTGRCKNAINPITRLKEVSYVKTPKKYVSGAEAKETSDSSESQSTPKKPKVNVQKALQLAATDNIKLDKIINLNQSLRSKKKTKKQKKAAKKKAEKSKGASSSSCSSRDSSRDRVKAAMAVSFVPPGPKAAKRPSSEISQSPKKTSSRWSSVDTLRHEKLREAMSVPVQSDKAMRMMLGMGWNGGALGPRGDGITEPLMPAFEIARGAGFGLISHRTQTQNSNSDTVPVSKKPKELNPPTPFAPGSDIVVEKTKQLLREHVTFDTIMNTTEPAKFKTNFEPSKPTTSKAELPTQARFSNGNQKLEKDLKLPPPFRMELLQSVWDLINSDASCQTLKYDRGITKNRKKFVNVAMQMLGGKRDPKLIIKRMFNQDELSICTQIRNKYMETQMIVEAHIFRDFTAIELIKVPKKFKPPTDLLELPEIFNPPTPLENKENTATITDCNQIINAVLENTATITNCNQIINGEDIKSYIFSANGRTRETLTSFKIMQFKVLFLIHMLKFVKSFNEEYEVTFNKVLAKKEKLYLENVVDQINMRIKIGSSQAETKLGDLIRQHVKGAFLGIMYDHEHTTITLSKYFRFKRLNRPDNAVRRKAQATVNLDDFTSETLIEPKLNTDKPFDREIKNDSGKDKYEFSEHNSNVTETDNTQVSTENTTINVSDDETSEALPNSNELGSYDSDVSSVEEYKNNNANAKVPKLLPGEEGVNISNFLHLYDKEKSNTAGIRNNSIINNDSASNVTENMNSKNNSGNGNVVIDNNDNQFIDMKRAGGNAQDTQKKNNVYSEKAECVVCVDDKEEKELKSAENSIEIDSKEIDLPEYVNNVANDPKIITYIIDACKDIGDDILQINDEVTLNTEDLDPNIIVIEDSDSDNDGTENKAKDKMKNITKKLPLEDYKEETDLIIKDMDADKTMKIINITEDSMEGINTEPVHGIVKDDSNAVINKDKSKVAINPGDPTPVIITGETMAVIDKDESQEVIDIDKSKAVIHIDESKAAFIQGKSKEVINKGESKAVINTNDSTANDVVNKDVSEVQIIQGESMAVFNTVESSKDKEVAQIKEGTSIKPSDENIVKDDLVIKSDCDRIKKDNIVLSEEFCNTQSVKSSREQTAGTETDFLYDKDSEIKNVLIGHTHHPVRMLSKEKIEKIQWHISNCIKLATELPLLKCHGFQNGALFYTCHSKKTYDWLQNTIGVASYVKVFDTKEVTKMALKLCGYFDFDSNYLFKMLEMYNKEISTKEWVVEKTEKKGDDIIFIVKMDKFSIKFIQESDLALFAGIDKVNFSLIWE